MGYNTPILVLNDRLNEIETDIYFGRKLAMAIREFQPNNKFKPYITGQTTILNVAHADTLQILAVGANSGRVIGTGHWTMDDEAIITHLYREMLAAKKAKKRGS